MTRAGDAVYLPLKSGEDEIVLAVTELTGGWGFWARIDPLGDTARDSQREHASWQNIEASCHS